MPQTPDSSPKMDFFGLLPAQIDSAVAERGWPKFRGRQLREWVYDRHLTDPASMTNLSKIDREKVPAWFRFNTSATARQQVSDDGTIKLLLTWPDGTNAETVMIPDGPRRTACVSSQVGCPVGCKFCASGLEGVKGNLSAAQIVEQVWMLEERSDAATKRRSDAATKGKKIQSPLRRFVAPSLRRFLRRCFPNESRTSSSWAWANRCRITPTSCRRFAFCTIHSASTLAREESR